MASAYGTRGAADRPGTSVTDMPPRSVMVGTDGSPGATEAVRRAANFAKAFGARLVVVCAYSRERSSAREGTPLGSMEGLAASPGGPSSTERLPEELSWRATPAGEAEAVASNAAGLARQLGVEEVEWFAVPGDPAEVLIAEAQSLPADLLVVGSKGLHSIARRLLGSVPAAVARHSPCDLLIVQTDAKRA